MGLWDKSVRLFQGLGEHGRQGVRHMAQPTGLSKRRGHRLQQAMAPRGIHPESWVWETAEGRRWVPRLIVATRSTFGLTRGVGLETMREFCTRLRLERQVGCAPSALRRVLPALEAASLATAGRGEQDGRAGRAGRESMGAVAETFLERMILVCMDLGTGDLRVEAGAEERTDAPGQAWVEERLPALGTGGRDRGRARAKAFSQLADHGLECLRMPDCFPVMHEVVQGYALALARRVRHARPEGQHAEEGWRTPPRLEGAPQAPRAAQQQGAARRAAVPHWERGHRTSRPPLAVRARTLPPWPRDASPPRRLRRSTAAWRPQSRPSQRSPRPLSAPPRTPPCTRSASRCQPWPPAWIFGGQALGRMWSRRLSPRHGG
jgi:hypothetical protein